MRNLFAAAPLLAAAIVNHAIGQQPANESGGGDPVRVARLVKDLGSADFDARERASAELARLGPQTREQLELAAESDDPEVRAHVLALLKRLKLDDLWLPSPIHCRLEGGSASQALTLLSEQTGNRLLVGDQYGAFQDAPVELTYDGAPFWLVLDEVCRQTGNLVRHHYDTRTPGLVVVSGLPGKYPTAYSGPVRARIASARRVFIEEHDYEDDTSEVTHSFQFNVQMIWEDRFRMVACRSQPELVEATTEAGDDLASAQPAGATWNVTSPGTRQLAMSLRMHPPSTSAERLRVLRLSWGLIAVGDMQTMIVNNLDSTAPHLADGIELVVESVQERPGGRYELSLVVNRDLVVPTPPEILFQENDLALFDGDGRPFRQQGQTNSLTDRGARIRVTFVGESPQSAPKTLQFAYPRLRDERELQITFRDVPLPTARPE
jgi:hypothetical protein